MLIESGKQKTKSWNDKTTRKTGDPKVKRLQEKFKIKKNKAHKIESAKICHHFQRKNSLFFKVSENSIHERKYEHKNQNGNYTPHQHRFLN
jgi:hypothetical protein